MKKSEKEIYERIQTNEIERMMKEGICRLDCLQMINRAEEYAERREREKWFKMILDMKLSTKIQGAIAYEYDNLWRKEKK